MSSLKRGMSYSQSKQVATTFKSSIPAFPTIGDDVKAFGGYDYCSVYKKPKDVDEAMITRYEKKEFIPSHRLFWKVDLQLPFHL